VAAGTLVTGCGLFGRDRRDDTDTARHDRRLEEGRELARQDHLAEAAEAFEDAVYADPGSAEARFLLARVLLELGRAYPALDALREAERLRPGHGPQRVLMGQVLVRLGRLDEAEEVLVDAAERWPEDPRALFALGMLRMRQGRLTDAEVVLSRAANAAPRMPGVQEMLGRTLLRLGRADQAIVRFEDAIRQRDCDDLAHGGLAAALVMTSQPGQAQAELQRAIECAEAPDEGPWRAGLALAYATEGRYRDALAHLAEGESMFGAAALGVVRWRLGAAPDGWSAVGCRAHEVTCGRADEKLWSGLLLLYVMGAADAAERELRESIALYDGDPVAHWAMAEALLELGRVEEVGLELDRAITWDPGAEVRTAIDDTRSRAARGR
jgi:tetratricopeptide (TPR) repeat protein